jgi:hypothetical protein
LVLGTLLGACSGHLIGKATTPSVAELEARAPHLKSIQKAAFLHDMSILQSTVIGGGAGFLISCFLIAVVFDRRC